MAPVGAGHPVPPAADVVERHRPGRVAEYERTRHQPVGVDVRKVGRIGRVFGHGDVTDGLHEAAELGHRDRVFVHPEPVDRHPVDGPFLRIEVGRTHRELSAFDPAHVLRHRLSAWRPAQARPTPSRRSRAPRRRPRRRRRSRGPRTSRRPWLPSRASTAPSSRRRRGPGRGHGYGGGLIGAKLAADDLAAVLQRLSSKTLSFGSLPDTFESRGCLLVGALEFVAKDSVSHGRAA
jgi:hypothetical protein